MKHRIFIFLAVALLFAGCAGAPRAQEPPAQQPVPQPPEASITCAEYCGALAHAQCAGQWEVGGTYPDCSCNYRCTPVPAPQPAANTTNESAQQPVPPAAPGQVFVPTNKTLAEMLNDAISGFKSAFYSDTTGSFSERTYTWTRIPAETAADEITFAAAPASDVKFDGEEISSIAASGFVTFTRLGDDEPEAIYGIAVFRARQTPLDSYTGSDAYDIEYFPKPIDKELRDCWTKGKDYNMNGRNETLVTYFFECEGMEDK